MQVHPGTSIFTKLVGAKPLILSPTEWFGNQKDIKIAFKWKKKKKSVNVIVLRTVSFARFEVKDICVHVSVCADF